jgi:uncharacterized RDD family membrane protein YckC
MDELQAGGGRISAVATGSPSSNWRQLPPLAPSPAYAGFWRRFLAALIDGVLVSFAFYQLNLLLALTLASVIEEGDTADGTWLALAVWLTASLTLCLVVNWFYFAVMESSPWQATLGKCALGMVVTDLAGNRISFGRATGRLFARFISGIPLMAGYLIQPFTARRQTLHDMISGTLVVVRG